MVDGCRDPGASRPAELADVAGASENHTPGLLPCRCGVEAAARQPFTGLEGSPYAEIVPADVERADVPNVATSSRRLLTPIFAKMDLR